MDDMFNQIVEDLMERYSYSEETAVRLMYNGGLEIYSAMDQRLQSDLERFFLTNTDMLPADEQAQRMILWSLADSLYSLDPVTEIRLLADGEELELFGNIPVESIAVRPQG